MTERRDDPDRGTRFRLSYDLRLDDLTDLIAGSRPRRRRRVRMVWALAVWLLWGVILTAIIVVLNDRSLVKDSTGAPGWLYPITGLSWGIAIAAALRVWRLGPKRLARRAWGADSRLRGSHHDEIGETGVTSTVPDGTQVFLPWARFVEVRETEAAFQLLDDKGTVMNALPKRGLDRSDLLPELRDFLLYSVGS